MRKNSGTIRHTIAGAALVLMLMPAGRAGAETPGCDWTGWAFWKGADPAQVAARVDRCIAVGADPNARAVLGQTPLHRAARYGTPEIVAALLEAGADPTARGEDGKTPLHLAAAGGTPGTVAALLDAGADPKARTWADATPLHWAARFGELEIVAALLDAGANPKARAKDGSLPADLAEDNAAVRDHDIFWTLNQARFD